jgi:hypothetical protein
MPDPFAPRSGVVLVKSPNVRQQAARRRLAAAAGILALALASGLVGALSHSPGEPLGKRQIGPFSYFPSE